MQISCRYNIRKRKQATFRAPIFKLSTRPLTGIFRNSEDTPLPGNFFHTSLNVLDAGCSVRSLTLRHTFCCTTTGASPFGVDFWPRSAKDVHTKRGGEWTSVESLEIVSSSVQQLASILVSTEA